MKFMKLLSVILVLSVNALLGMSSWYPAGRGTDGLYRQWMPLERELRLNVKQVKTLPGWERYEQDLGDGTFRYAEKGPIRFMGVSALNPFNAGIIRKGPPAVKVKQYFNAEEIFNELRSEYNGQFGSEYQPESLVNLSIKAVAQKIDDNKITLDQAKKWIPVDLHLPLEAKVKRLQELNPNKTRLTPELEKAMQEALEDFEKEAVKE